MTTSALATRETTYAAQNATPREQGDSIPAQKTVEFASF